MGRAFEDGDTIKSISKSSMLTYGSKYFLIHHFYSNNFDRVINSYEYYTEMGKFIGFDYVIPEKMFVLSRIILIEKKVKYPKYEF